MLHNNKFRHLLQTVFCNIQTHKIDETLDQLFESNICLVNNLRNIKQGHKTHMQKLFCIDKGLKNTSITPASIEYRNIEDTTKKPSQQMSTNKKMTELPPNKAHNIATATNKALATNKAIATNKVTKIGDPGDIMKRLSQLSSNYYIHELSKTGDYLSTCVFTVLSKLFNISPTTYKNQLLKNIKMDIITIFNKENYYKNYDYSIKYFKKSDAENTFINNLPITSNMLKIYGDVFNINMIYIKDKTKTFITKFNIDNATIIISESNHNVAVLCSNEGYIRGKYLSNILDIDRVFIEKDLDKLSLDNLQNIAKMKNINIKKAGKTGKINVKKQELIDLITNK